MKKLLILLTLALAPLWALADDPPVQTSEAMTVTIASRGQDVRAVVHDLFTQSKKNYVLDQRVPRIELFLSLQNVDFDEALELICAQSNLRFTVQNGVYFLERVPAMKPTAAPTKPSPAPTPAASAANKPKPTSAASANAAPVRPLTEQDLQKRITTRLAKTPLRTVIKSLADQTGYRIEIDPATPDYKLDAFLINTSLKYALDVITKATSLEYVLTPQRTILIRPVTTNRVAVVSN